MIALASSIARRRAPSAASVWLFFAPVVVIPLGWGMAFRFRKSVKIIPGVRLNFSKSGVSTSLGGRGATINLSSRGTRHTVGIPGSGLSFSSFTSKGGSTRGSTGSTEASSGCGCLVFIALAILFLSRCADSSPPEDAKSYPSPTEEVGPAGEPSAVAAQFDEGSSVYVTATALNARAEPTTDGAVVGKFARGQRLEVRQRSGDWLKVVQGATVAWIAASHVSQSAPVQSLLSENRPSGRSQSRNAKPRPARFSGGSCPCSGDRVCIGPRGGRYCITSGGNKRYGV